MKYYGEGKFYFNAFTVLDCAKCKWRVWLEAHHNDRGRPLAPIYARHWKKQVKCPKCKSPNWLYVRTEVMSSKKVHAFHKLTREECKKFATGRIPRRKHRRTTKR